VPDLAAQLLKRANSALLLVDLQYRLVSAVYEPERVIRNTVLLLRLAEVLRIPTILTTQNAKRLGNIHPEIVRTVKDAEVFDKITFGCFADPDFAGYLQTRAPRANTLLIVGIESHICVAQTALGALDTGYLVHVPGDAVSSRSAANWQLGLGRMERAGAVISSTEMMVYELLGQAGTPEFRAVLPLLK
jgi:nicotinamidase-related amidase